MTQPGKQVAYHEVTIKFTVPRFSSDAGYDPSESFSDSAEWVEITSALSRLGIEDARIDAEYHIRVR